MQPNTVAAQLACLLAVFAALLILCAIVLVPAVRAQDGAPSPHRVSLPLIVASTRSTAPAITSVPVLTGTVGITYAYTVQVSGHPTPTLTLDTAPTGMALSADGLIEWTPAASGLYPVTLRAGNGVASDALQSFDITIAPQPTAPAITSTPPASGAVGASYAYLVQASGHPAPAIALDIAPTGMSIDDAGHIQWTPAAEGVYPVAVRASNGLIPDAVQEFSIDIGAASLTAPAITSAPPTGGSVGAAYTYQVQASGIPAPVTTLDLGPAGMTIDNGLIQWTPNAAGSYPVTVRAANGVTPDAVQSFIVDIGPQPTAPAITSAPVVAASLGEPYSYQVQASGVPAPAITLDLGPAGMTIGDNGLVEWTPEASGLYPVTVRAANGVAPDATQSFTIDVTQQTLAPTITSTPVLHATVGEPYAYQVQATGVPAPTFFWLETKPAGMTISPQGLIQWVPSAAGSYPVTVRAGNDVLPHATQSFAIDVALPPRIWDPRLTLRGATLVEAGVPSGQLYWRLIEARWLDEAESDGKHHIFMDVLDGDGVRKVDVRLRVSWAGGASYIWSQEKPGEPYAADFAMYAVAPAYAAAPSGALPADRVEGMGLGTIESPWNAHHTSYELTWQLAVMP